MLSNRTSSLELVRQFQCTMDKVKTLNLDAAEYACLKAIVLFSTGA